MLSRRLRSRSVSRTVPLTFRTVTVPDVGLKFASMKYVGFSAL